MKTSVYVNQKNNLIVLKLSKDAKYEDIKKSIKIKIEKLKSLYKEEKTPILITGKVLKNKEIEEIEEIIKEKIDVDIEFDMPRELGLSNIKKTFIQEVSNSETRFHRGSLRSGQRIEEEGSIVIIGDVNSGAEVIAAENIIVLGALRGLAHAGAKGNNKAIIAAGKLDTVQLRISNVVKEFGKEEEYRGKTYIYIDEDKIIIDPV